MSQSFAPGFNNPSSGPSPSPEKNRSILGLSPSTILMIVVGLVAFGIIYNYENKE
jgi:hypothetical protein